MPKLKIGSLWVKGIDEEFPEYDEITVDVRFSPKTMQMFSPWEKTARENAIIPRALYPISASIRKSRIVVVPARGVVRGLLIPCSEIFRFYYAPTSKLATALLDGTFLSDRGSIVNLKRSKLSSTTGAAYVQLGKKADDDERIEIARMTFDITAREAAESIIPTAIAQGSAGEFPLIVRPPFDGRSQLRVQGMRITIGGYPAFLVFAILECSGPFPWSRLWWNRNNPGKQGRKKRSGSTPAYAGTFRKTISTLRRESAKVSQRDDPSAKDVPLRVDGGLSPSRYKTTFTDQRTKRGPIQTTSASVYDAEALSGAVFGIGRGIHGSRYRAATFSASEAAAIPHKISSFRSAVAALESLDEAIVFLDEDVYDIVKPSTPDAVEPPWAYLDRFERQRPRRAAVARLRLGDVPFALIDTETRARKSRTSAEPTEEPFAIGVLRSPYRRAVSDDDLQRLLRAIVLVRGVVGGLAWSRTGFASWRHATLRHISGEQTERYAQRMLSAIRGAAQSFD